MPRNIPSDRQRDSPVFSSELVSLAPAAPIYARSCCKFTLEMQLDNASRYPARCSRATSLVPNNVLLTMAALANEYASISASAERMMHLCQSARQPMLGSLIRAARRWLKSEQV